MRNARFAALAVFSFLVAMAVILYVQDYDYRHQAQIDYEETIVDTTLTMKEVVP